MDGGSGGGKGTFCGCLRSISSMAWPKASDRSDLSLVIEFGLAGTICILIFLGPKKEA